MKKVKALSVSLRILACALFLFVYFWFALPPINLRSPDFWSFLILSVIVCFVINAFGSLIGFIKNTVNNNGSRAFSKNDIKSNGVIKAAIVIIGISILVMLIGSVIGAKIFNASRYNKLISVSDGDFSKDVEEISMSQIPIVDKDTASRLGKRKLGEMSDLVSQFEIVEQYTQINYHGSPYRVTPLTYGDPIKWFYNQSEGIPAYITVNMVTQETSLVRLENGIKYSPNEYFLRNLNRHLRFLYPTKIFDDISFEIDESGTPYWVAPTISYKVGIWDGRDISGAVLLNAQTGEAQYYDLEDIPSWVDQVFVSDLVVEQLGYYGKYQSGFFNSIFGQKGVLSPTDGYNYLTIGDDVYLYTGMTSVLSDESNVGFVLINLRTKETKFYSVPGAEEYSAMSSAEGQVQNLKYTSTFPLLLNVSDRPTYFMSLKDDAGLVKMYAFVDVEQYQVVGTGNTVNDARANYIAKLKQEDVEIKDNSSGTDSGAGTVTGKIESISSAVVDGNTCYYIMLKGSDTVYTASITVSNTLPFLKTGDQVTVISSVQDGVCVVSQIEKAS